MRRIIKLFWGGGGGVETLMRELFLKTEEKKKFTLCETDMKL